MSHVFSNADKAPAFFACIGRETGVVYFVVNGFPPGESKQRADVGSRTSGNRDGNRTDGAVICVIQEETHIRHRKQPSAGERSRTVQESISHPLDVLNTPFTRILVLLVRFTLPARNTQCTQYIQNPFTDFGLGAIAQELFHCSPIANVILQCIDQLLLCSHTIDVSDGRFRTDIDLCACTAIINGRDITIHCIHGNGLFTSMHI